MAGLRRTEHHGGSCRLTAGQPPAAVVKKGDGCATAWVGGALALLAAIAALIYFAPWKNGEASPGKSSPAVFQSAAGEGGTKVAVAGASAAKAAILAAATKDHPFVNTLGMRFVPVPILGGPTGGQRVLFSVWDTRVQDYAEFVKETKREWPKPDFPQEPTHPAVNASWEDAQLFCRWLTGHERAAERLPANWSYRLPSDHEWSCGVGLGAREDATKPPTEKNGKIDAFPWGTEWPPPKGAGNYAGEEVQPALAEGKFSYGKRMIAGYDDGSVNTSPVGSFAANRFGLFDMGGNVWQWCEDWFDKDRRDRVLRGASWSGDDRLFLMSSYRRPGAPGRRSLDYGFRCVIALPLR